jgi:hypothetical protein
MRITVHDAVYHQEAEDMEQIDVHDLPEEQAQLLQEFVEFLKQRMREHGQAEEHPPTFVETPVFAAWPLGSKVH